MLFLGAVALCGISINYLSKNNPRFRGCFTDMALNSAASQSKINLNQATLEELTALTGIGPELARRIIDYRAAYGGFKASEELKKVKGIGTRKFELLEDRITLE